MDAMGRVSAVDGRGASARVVGGWREAATWGGPPDSSVPCCSCRGGWDAGPSDPCLAGAWRLGTVNVLELDVVPSM